MSQQHNPRIQLLFVHPFPHRSIANARLLASVSDLSTVAVNDLYENYPDFHIEIQREQQILSKIDLLVVQFPFYWYSPPAMFKQWQDTVLAYGFAFGKGGDALRGKDWLNVVTVGQMEETYRQDGYNRYRVEELLNTLECTANHCGMNYLPPIILHNAHNVSEPGMDEVCTHYRQRLKNYQPTRGQADG